MPFSHPLVDYQETGEIHLVHEGGSIYNEKWVQRFTLQ